MSCLFIMYVCIFPSLFQWSILYSNHYNILQPFFVIIGGVNVMDVMGGTYCMRLMAFAVAVGSMNFRVVWVRAKWPQDTPWCWNHWSAPDASKYQKWVDLDTLQLLPHWFTGRVAEKASMILCSFGSRENQSVVPRTLFETWHHAAFQNHKHAWWLWNFSFGAWGIINYGGRMWSHIIYIDMGHAWTCIIYHHILQACEKCPFQVWRKCVVP